nr:transposase, Ptta/En/Spm [Tanacetum cinerariifolium]
MDWSWLPTDGSDRPNDIVFRVHYNGMFFFDSLGYYQGRVVEMNGCSKDSVMYTHLLNMLAVKIKVEIHKKINVYVTHVPQKLAEPYHHELILDGSDEVYKEPLQPNSTEIRNEGKNVAATVIQDDVEGNSCWIFKILLMGNKRTPNQERQKKDWVTNDKDIDYNPEDFGETEENYQEVATHVSAPKKLYRRQYIAPMSMNRYDNLSKQWVSAPNISRVIPWPPRKQFELKHNLIKRITLTTSVSGPKRKFFSVDDDEWENTLRSQDVNELDKETRTD